MNNIQSLAEGSSVSISGTITELIQLFTKKKDEPLAALKIKSPKGTVSAVLFPKQYKEYGDLLVEGRDALFKGTISKRTDDREQQQLNISEVILAK